MKVCGLTRAADVEEAVAAGADAIGLILAPESPRCLEPDKARELARRARALNARVRVVAVVTQQEAAELVRLARQAEVDLVQLHGGQPEAVRRQLEAAGFGCLRTLWLPGPHEAAADPEPCLQPGREAAEPPAPWAFLLDRRRGRRLGGTGLTHDPQQAAQWVRRLSVQAPVVLAGGLGPENVAVYLERARPWGVDASSSLEVPGQVGVKDPRRIRAFLEAVRRWEREHGTGLPLAGDGRTGASPGAVAAGAR